MLNFTLTGFADEASQSLTGQIAALKRNGMGYFEPRGIDDKNIADFSVEDAEALKKTLDEADIQISSLGSPYGKIEITDDFEPHFEKFKNTVAVAKILDVKYIRMFSFFFTKGESFDEYRDEVLRRVKLMADYAYENGVRCCLENEKGIYGDNAARCLEVLTEVPELQGVFDPANFVQCGQDTLEAWEMLKNRIFYMHIKDALFRDSSVVPAGRGDGHVKEILDAFLARGGKDLTLEPHLAIFDGLKGLERKGDRSIVGSGAFVYASNDEAFDAAAAALRALLA